MAVVLVGRNGVQTESTVGRRIDRQRIVVAHEEAFAIAPYGQLRRQGAVEGPQCFVVLDRHAGMELDRQTVSGPCDVYTATLVGLRHLIVETARSELANTVGMQLLGVAETSVDPGSGLCRLEENLREEFVPALVGPALARRPTLGR